MMIRVEYVVKLVKLAGETEILDENLPLCPPEILHDLT
jgi:hypothetical protein